ncbi:response regulator [Collimonas sp. H4R21]|jgi:two-component system chemotaxis response regulator CheY|uniref:Response regulator n=1 Tax=Collimonas rhizosphaerae TaxID=3126357 RepID=A0ABU9Q132_9BURK|nr:response regulator [Collimonas sp. OK412]SFC90670.1 two-component system, chemotaxis family, response regulator CheY [Collimonas sp. OK412]
MTTRTILVVDDSAVMRKLIAAALAEGDYQVLLAADGTAAMLHARTAAVDLVLTDWNMPAMGGHQLIRALRQLENHAETPILVLTTEASDAEKSDARAAGASGWLRKPIEPATLLEVVASMLAE